MEGASRLISTLRIHSLNDRRVFARMRPIETNQRRVVDEDGILFDMGLLSE